jgi:hypothetical protein
MKYTAIIFFIFLMGWDWAHFVLFGLQYQPQIIDDNDDDFGAIGGMRIDRGNRITRRKPARATLYITDPTWSDQGSNPGRRIG